MDDLYRVFQKSGRGRNGSFSFTTTTDDTTLITVSSAINTLNIQTVYITIKTDAAQSITFQDSAASPVYVCKVTTSPGADTRWAFDFGPKGMPLTLGKNFVANCSAVGLACHIEWTAYQTPQNIS